MRYRISHITSYEYAPPAHRIVMRLRLFPSMFEGQYVENWDVKVNGEALTPLHRSEYGDEVALWTSSLVGAVTIEAQGLVERTETSGVSRDLPGRMPTGVFLRQTPLTAPDEAVLAFGQRVTAAAGLPWLHELMAMVNETVVYSKGSSNTQTTAAQALSAGCGVCQDQAHVFISVARAFGYAARYVVGYLNDPEMPELETHGWAEVRVPDLGWVGFDPSHKVSPTVDYVRLTCGLDAHDAAPVRGVVLGGGPCAPAQARVEIEASGAEQQ